MRSAPCVRLLTSCLTLCLLAGVTRAGDDDWISLNALDAYKKAGDWQIVGGVTLDEKNPRKLTAQPGTGVMYNGPKGTTNDLVTKQAFSDIELKFEFLVPQRSNSGVKFQGVYEIQIIDNPGAKELTGDSTGGIYPRAELTPTYRHIDKGIPPKVKAAKPAGEWQSLEAIFLAPRFDDKGKKTTNARLLKVVLNGQLIHDNVELATPTGHNWTLAEKPKGPILFQADHGPVAFRNIVVRAHTAGAKKDGR